jgi:hypothetical protein
MTNTYRAVSDRAKALNPEGVFEADLSPSEELDALSGGHLELVPRTYKVMSDNYSAAAQGETFVAAYPVENEAALIFGGHIERVEIVGEAGPEVLTPEPGTVVPAPKKKKED